MRVRESQAVSPLVDQAIVSLGTFILGIMLARVLVPAEYGAFALLFGTLFVLQIVNATLVFYPMAVRCSVAEPARTEILVRASLVIVAALCGPLCAILALVNVATGRLDLILPSILYFLSWQAQEHCRRALFADMRHGGAIIGDAISYGGQTFLVAMMIWSQQAITIETILYTMALTSAAAAILQARQLGLRLGPVGNLREIAADYWRIGRCSLANNVLWVTRVQLLIWILAYLYGALATASFQAVLNTLNLANPVILGLCNIIPQLAARAVRSPHPHGWRAVWTCALLGAPVALILYGIALFAPSLLLQTFYGAGSPYLALELPVRILALAFIIGYPTEMICSFLHGIDAPQWALAINAAGMAMSASLALPLTLAYGVDGACSALLISAILRLALGGMVMMRLGRVGNEVGEIGR
ncbi:hypothetical protein [Methylobacterium marchantiae]|uniref:Lipopolysaccharide biosynthesis protein n=1 Tax=Methylobacterium marchantiae TaxID=600331 RepID=A0ABW3X1V3_9HYPH